MPQVPMHRSSMNSQTSPPEKNEKVPREEKQGMAHLMVGSALRSRGLEAGVHNVRHGSQQRQRLALNSPGNGKVPVRETGEKREILLVFDRS